MSALLFGLAGCDSGGNVPSGVGDSTSVSFSEPEAVVGEGDESYTVDLTISDAGFKDVPVTVSFNASQSSATRNEDVEVPSDTTIQFPESASSGDSRALTIGVIDDDEFLEGDETAVFDLGIADSVEAMAGETAQFTLTIEENDETVTTQGARDLETGSRAVIEGTVTRVDGSDGVYLQDDVGALFVFDSDVAGEVSRGDEVRVDGTTAFFSGLFQLSDVGTDGVTVLSSGNDLPGPQTITFSDLANGGGEQFESQLVRVQDFSIDAGGDQVFQGDTDYNIQNSSGSSMLSVPAGSELVGENIPDRATFQGVLSQFNGGSVGANEPDEGYQLLGLLSSDLEVTSTTFALEADATDLEPASGNGSTECMARLSTGELVFFNAADGGIFIWDGSSLIEHRSASNLNSDVPDESGDFDACDGAATEAGSVYFLLRSSTTNDNYVYRTEAADAGDNSFTLFNGANTLAADENTVYIGAISAFGAPGDGIFEVSGDLSGSVTELVTDSDVNPTAVSLDDQGTLFGYSGSFGSGNLESALFTVDVTASSKSVDAYVDPYRSGSPLSQTGNEITDLAPVTVDGEQFLVVYNASFDGSNGEEWGAIQRSDQSIELLFTEDDLVANLSVSEYTSGTAPLAASGEGNIFAASLPEFGASNYVAKVSNALQ